MQSSVPCLKRHSYTLLLRIRLFSILLLHLQVFFHFVQLSLHSTLFLLPLLQLQNRFRSRLRLQHILFSYHMNIVMAMNMGGDDFIAKPFDLQVLTAKLQAVLRRSYGSKLTSHSIECGEVVLNLNDTSVAVRGEKIDLTKNEFLILKTLMEKQGKVVSREEIMERLWGNDEFVDDNTLTVNITRIRKKLEAAGVDDFITTKRGLGYLVGA